MGWSWTCHHRMTSKDGSSFDTGTYAFVVVVVVESAILPASGT